MKMVDREPTWDTPLGRGRPGWHIEDTAITEKYFGPQYDIHGGAVELKFPHHEAEISQQESASGKKPFVKIWMHTGILLINGQKMSKSLKNFITIKDFLKKYSADVLRMIVLSHHYRSPMDYNEGMALQAQRSLRTIYEFLAKLRLTQINADNTRINADSINGDQRRNQRISAFLSETRKKFNVALEDDFNTPQALGTLFGLINEINKIIWGLGKKTARTINKIILDNFNILGIELKPPKIPAKINALIEEREQFRRNKQFIPADLLRKKIEALGYSIEDTPQGPLVLWKS
jgi:cysteinyl-tRNA synthetase